MSNLDPRYSLVSNLDPRYSLVSNLDPRYSLVSNLDPRDSLVSNLDPRDSLVSNLDPRDFLAKYAKSSLCPSRLSLQHMARVVFMSFHAHLWHLGRAPRVSHSFHACTRAVAVASDSLYSISAHPPLHALVAQAT